MTDKEKCVLSIDWDTVWLLHNAYNNTREDYLHNKRGFNILRISNTDILSMNSEQLSKLISTI